MSHLTLQMSELAAAATAAGAALDLSSVSKHSYYSLNTARNVTVWRYFSNVNHSRSSAFQLLLCKGLQVAQLLGVVPYV